eukprot:1822936-Rhodomonas_salina.2
MAYNATSTHGTDTAFCAIRGSGVPRYWYWTTGPSRPPPRQVNSAVVLRACCAIGCSDNTLVPH